MSLVDLPAVGTRINFSGHLGTIRFAGRVLDAPGLWLGVEWDDPQRGKHDGVKDGHRYFTCFTAGAGSFIRPSSTITYGVSFTHALVSKYIEALHGEQTLEKVLLGSSNGVVEVEAVGLDKIRGKLARLERLREISLDGEDVASVDAPGEIRNKCPNVRGLDLTKNLLPSWDVVALIARELEYLERLALNQNRLLPPSSHTLMASSFFNLSELQLNGTMTSWQQLTELLLPYMPKIELVEMGYNRLTRLSEGPKAQSVEKSPSTIKALNLDGNFLSDWADICQSIYPYHTLTRLILVSNHVIDISPLGQRNLNGLSRLKYLALSHNGISSWSCIDALAIYCPKLESLALTGDPLSGEKNHRAFVIARMASLMSFNGGTITAKERVDCELFYLSHIGQYGARSDDERSRDHPRYQELCLKYGAPDTSVASIDGRQDTLANQLILLNVHRTSTPLTNGGSISTIHTSSSTALRVLPMMNLRTLRLKIRKTFRGSTKATPSLYLQMNDGVIATLDVDQDMHDLAWWGLGDGANIYVYMDNE